MNENLPEDKKTSPDNPDVPGEDLTEEINLDRKPWLAALSSAIVPGLGHLYSGKPLLAIAIYMVPTFGAALLLALMVTSDADLFNILLALPVLWFGVYIAQILWAVVEAGRAPKPYQLKSCNRILLYMAFVFVTMMVDNYGPINGLVAENFTVSAESMLPLLLPGDRVLVAKLGDKNRIYSRGDLVVLKDPEDPENNYLKRVVGMPQEELKIVGDVVYINGEPIKENFVTLQENDSAKRLPDFGPLKIGEGHLFLLGDNRN
ncbi:signal peptidase I, partial [Myxococcota bacterium]|nr:signal peptidase I [Myxococcota bacterium]